MIWLAGGNQFKIRLPFSWGFPLILHKSHNNAHTTHGQNSGRKPLTIFNINAVRETAAAVRFVVPRQHFDPNTEQNTHTARAERNLAICTKDSRPNDDGDEVIHLEGRLIRDRQENREQQKTPDNKQQNINNVEGVGVRRETATTNVRRVWTVILE